MEGRPKGWRRCVSTTKSQSVRQTPQPPMGARHYNPATATFTSRDTYNGRLDTPVSLNRYTYAHNNPLNLWDPNGHAPLPEELERYDRFLRKVNASDYADTQAGRAAYEKAIADVTSEYLLWEYLSIKATFGHLGDNAVNWLAAVHASQVTTPVIRERLAVVNLAWLRAHPNTDKGRSSPSIDARYRDATGETNVPVASPPPKGERRRLEYCATRGAWILH